MILTNTGAMILALFIIAMYVGYIIWTMIIGHRKEKKEIENNYPSATRTRDKELDHLLAVDPKDWDGAGGDR